MKNPQNDTKVSKNRFYASPEISLVSYEVTPDWCTSSTLQDWEDGKHIVDGI